MTEFDSTIADLQRLSLRHAETSLWVVKRSLVGREARYSARKVETETALQQRLRINVEGAISRVESVAEFEYLTEDQDGRALTLPAGETDFPRIQEEIDRGSSAPRASSIEDLINAWGYVVKLQMEGAVLYAFRKVSSRWTTRKITTFANLVFEGEMLVDLSDKRVFQIDDLFDFVVFRDTMLVLDKRQFEVALNFREHMLTARDRVLDEFDRLGIFHDVSPIREVIGNNIRLLRKLATVEKRGYFRQNDYMERLHEIAETQGWELEIVEAKIKVTEDNVDLIMTLIGNDRLKSLINEEMFDVVVKHSVK